jgi:hypothetical protein
MSRARLLLWWVVVGSGAAGLNVYASRRLVGYESMTSVAWQEQEDQDLADRASRRPDQASAPGLAARRQELHRTVRWLRAAEVGSYLVLGALLVLTLTRAARSRPSLP